MKNKRKNKFVRQRQYIQEFIRELKGSTPCLDCHRHYPYYVMEFDHVTGKKEANISDLSRNSVNVRDLFKELSKCEIVCSNCHKARTWKRATGRDSLAVK